MIELKLTIKQDGEKLRVAMTGGDGMPTSEEFALAYLLLIVVHEACECSLKNGVGMSTESDNIKERIRAWQRHA